MVSIKGYIHSSSNPSRLPFVPIIRRQPSSSTCPKHTWGQLLTIKPAELVCCWNPTRAPTQSGLWGEVFAVCSSAISRNRSPSGRINLHGTILHFDNPHPIQNPLGVPGRIAFGNACINFFFSLCWTECPCTSSGPGAGAKPQGHSIAFICPDISWSALPEICFRI